MTAQLSLFDHMRLPIIQQQVDPDGPVVEDPDLVLTFRDPKKRWLYASLEIHPAGNERWMWSCSYGINNAGGGYAPGLKWGKFASSQNDAIYYAAAELIRRVTNAMEQNDKFARQVLAWAAEQQA